MKLKNVHHIIDSQDSRTIQIQGSTFCLWIVSCHFTGSGCIGCHPTFQRVLPLKMLVGCQSHIFLTSQKCKKLNLVQIEIYKQPEYWSSFYIDSSIRDLTMITNKCLASTSAHEVSFQMNTAETLCTDRTEIAVIIDGNRMCWRCRIKKLWLFECMNAW